MTTHPPGNLTTDQETVALSIWDEKGRDIGYAIVWLVDDPSRGIKPGDIKEAFLWNFHAPAT